MGTFPERVLGAVNAGLTAIVDLGLAPAIRVAPLATLLVVSVATGLAMLWVIGRTSNQAGISRAKRGIHAALFEIANVYLTREGRDLPDERTRVALVGSGDFFAAKGTVEALLDRLHVADELEASPVEMAEATD